jgi:hypothetical protein
VLKRRNVMGVTYAAGADVIAVTCYGGGDHR